MNWNTLIGRPDTIHRQIGRLAVIMGGAYCILCALVLTGFDNRIMFQPHKARYSDSDGVFKLTTPAGTKISAFYLPSPGAKYTILFSHGNGEDLGDIIGDLTSLSGMGFSVFAYEYEGYGTSEGSPSEAKCYADINTAYKYLTGDLKIPPGRIIVHGRSVGGGPSVDLASREPVGGLILESAFTSAFNVSLIGRALPGDRFRNIDKIGLVKCPVLVMHGTRDIIIPFRQGQKLFAAAPEPKRCLWVEGAGHNDLMWVADKKYNQAIDEFIALVEKGGP